MTDASTPQGEAEGRDLPPAVDLSHPSLPQPLPGVTEYAEEMDVELDLEGQRVVVVAYNQAGHDQTRVDLADLLATLGLREAAEAVVLAGRKLAAEAAGGSAAAN